MADAGEFDGLAGFDDDAWRESGESLAAGYAAIDEEIARWLGVGFTAGEVGDGPTPEMVVDASEIITAFASGGGSSIGSAAATVDRAGRGLLARFARDRDRWDRDRTTPIRTTGRKATLGRLTSPARHGAPSARCSWSPRLRTTWTGEASNGPSSG